MAIQQTDREQQCATAASMRPLKVTIEKDQHCRLPTHSKHSVLPETISALNNVLHIIGGTADVLEEYMWPKHAGAEKYLRLLRASVARAASLSAQLAGYTGAESDRVVIHPSAREPLMRSQLASVSQARQPERVKAPVPRVLIVDDQPMALILAEKLLLAAAKLEVVTACGGAECLRKFAAAPSSFTLVVLDLTMPLMDGEETFNRLRGIDPKVRVLLNSGFIARDRADRMFANGLTGLLTKPTPPEEYVGRVLSLITPDGGWHCKP